MIATHAVPLCNREMNKLRLKPVSVTDEQIRNHYETCTFDLLPYSEHRQFRLLLCDGNMHVIRKRVSSADVLRSECLKFLPVGVYQTVSLWSDPSSLSNKGSPKHGGSTVVSNSFMGADLLLDFDAAHCSHANLKLAFDWLQATCFAYDLPLKIVRTGSGYHFWVLGWYSLQRLGYTSSPFRREQKCLHAMRKKVTSLKASGLRFDYNISVDTRRLARVPGSLHANGKPIATLAPSVFDASLNSLQR